MPLSSRPLLLLTALCLALTSCTGGSATPTASPTPTAPAVTPSSTAPSSTAPSSTAPSTTAPSTTAPSTTAPSTAGPSTTAQPTVTRPTGQFTLALAGDVHFMERTADLLAANPATAFGAVIPVLSKADLTMVNLETAITTSSEKASKSYNFQAPASAFSALRGAGIDLVTMANNHAADYGAGGLADTLTAIRGSRFPTIGIGVNADAAFAPFVSTINGVKVAIVAASQISDETAANFSAGADSAGIANAHSDRLPAMVTRLKAQGYTVIVYLHWGTEYTQCPNPEQRALADTLAEAGATAVVGTHAHQLQGAGWRDDGVYVAYGLSNYFWWRSFGNLQDDAGVLTLTVRPGRVAAASFDAAHLDPTGVAPPATGAERNRIDAEWEQARVCAGLGRAVPAR